MATRLNPYLSFRDNARDAMHDKFGVTWLVNIAARKD